MLNDAFYALLSFLPWVSALIVGLLLLRRSKARLSARFYRGEWLLLALRCALPFSVRFPHVAPLVQLKLPAGAVSAQPMVSPAQTVGADALTQATMRQEAPPTAQGVSLLQIAAWVWLAGVAAVLLWHAAGYAVLWLRLRKTRAAVPLPLHAQAAAVWGAPLAVYRTPLLRSPALVGLLSPQVYLPQGLALSESALELVLQHEHCHARHCDIPAKLLLTLACAVCWANPLVWLLRSAAEEDMERACDEELLRGRTVEYRRAYGAVLLQTLCAGGKTPLLSTGFAGSRHAVKERFQAMFDRKEKKNARLLLAVLAAVVFAASVLVACGAPVQPASAPKDGDGAADSLPARAASRNTGAQAEDESASPNLQTGQLTQKEQLEQELPEIEVELQALGERLQDSLMPQEEREAYQQEYEAAQQRLQEVEVLLMAHGEQGVDAAAHLEVVEIVPPLLVKAEMTAGNGNGHKGQDFKAPLGTPVYACAAGTVTTAEFDAAKGNYIVLEHDGGFITRYAHLSELLVSKGETVQAGQQIGAVGNTGNSSGNHLHLEVEQDGTMMDMKHLVEP